MSYDAVWHRRGHYSNQGFAAAIEILSATVLANLCNPPMKPIYGIRFSFIYQVFLNEQ